MHADAVWDLHSNYTNKNQRKNTPPFYQTDPFILSLLRKSLQNDEI